MKIIKLLGSIILISFGIFLVIYGEGDDSPGAQLLGLIAVILGVVGVIKSKK